MSLLWRDEVGVFLGPGKLVMSRMRRGLRGLCVAQHFTPLEHQAGAGDWSRGLLALSSELTDPKWRDAHLRVVLADAWVRYALVPSSEALEGEDERLQHARYFMAQVYGDTLEDWDIALADGGGTDGCVAAAMPRALVDGIKAMRTGSAQIASIQPQLITAFNAWSWRLPPTGGWFVTIEQGSLSAAHFTERGWDRVHSVRIGREWSAELRRLRTFGRLALGSAADERVFVDAPLWLRRIAGAAGEGLEWLEEQRAGAGTLDTLVELRGQYA
ncbi:MAG: hypothetical protein ACRER4_02415 [Steroidobacteraceae bacterium]